MASTCIGRYGSSCRWSSLGGQTYRCPLSFQTLGPFDVTAEVPGDLLQWLRTADDEWLGLVTYQLPFADERHQCIYLERQLLPAYALRPRKYGAYRN